MTVTAGLCIAIYKHYYPVESKYPLKDKNEYGGPSAGDDDAGIERISDEDYLR